MTIAEIQALPHGELCAALDTLAPQVLAARAHYNELVAQQRLYLAARTLNDAGLRIGDKVRLRGSWSGKKDPIAIVLEPRTCLKFQVLRKDGEPHGMPVSEYMFQGFEKL